MSNYKKIIKILDIKENFKNPEVNNAIKSAKSVFAESMKKYKTPESFDKNVNIDDEIADLSVMLLSAADSYGDFEEEVEIRTLLELIWTEEEE